MTGRAEVYDEHINYHCSIFTLWDTKRFVSSAERYLTIMTRILPGGNASALTVEAWL